MLKGILYIQCKDKFGIRKDFIKNENGIQISPSFDNVLDAYDYCKKNNIKLIKN